MTREEATGKLLALATKCYNKHDTLDLAVNTIEEVYDGFETRKCRNCEYFAYEEPREIFCHYFERYVPIDLGKCDNWETKDD